MAIARTGRVRAEAITSRRRMFTNSGFGAASAGTARGSSAIPHSGQLPGASSTTSGCMGQDVLGTCRRRHERLRLQPHCRTRGSPRGIAAHLGMAGAGVDDRRTGGRRGGGLRGLGEARRLGVESFPASPPHRTRSVAPRGVRSPGARPLDGAAAHRDRVLARSVRVRRDTAPCTRRSKIPPRFRRARRPRARWAGSACMPHTGSWVAAARGEEAPPSGVEIGVMSLDRAIAYTRQG